MLVRLFGSNFRSLKKPFELSIVAADLKRKEDHNRGIIEVPMAGWQEPLRLLRAVALFGSNASGKSTVLQAALALRWLGTDSSARAKPGGPIPCYEPFALDDQCREVPTELGCDVVFQQSLLRYEVRFTATSINREALTHFIDGEEVKLIERFEEEIRGKLIEKSEANRLYVKEMQPNVTILAKLAQFGPHKGKESVQPYYEAIRSATVKVDYSDVASTRIDYPNVDDERFAGDRKYREWVMEHLIRTADVGIRDVQIRRVNIDVPEQVRKQFEQLGSDVRFPTHRNLVQFVHEGDRNEAINFSYESSGTKKLFNIAGDWWRLAHDNITLFADELSASLHPRLLDQLVRAVNDASADQQSQLIFTTHDTGLMEGRDGQSPALRRDQIYFTKKDATGATELYSLAEFKDEARPVHNIRKRYLSGLYGAIPSVAELSL